MKNTVYTVITVVLLMATLCLPAAAQTWTLKASWGGPNGHTTGWLIYDIAFRDNHQVFYGKGNRLYKWDFVAAHAWWHDFGVRVKHVAIPRYDSDVVIHSRGGRHLNMRYTSDLSYITGATTDGMAIQSLDVDDPGHFLVVHSKNIAGFADPTPQWGYVRVYDLWDGGWQLAKSDREGSKPDNTEDVRMHPEPNGTDRRDFRYYDALNINGKISERIAGGGGDSYHSTWGSTIYAAAITTRFGSSNNTRVAGLGTGDIIHVWTWSGVHLFTFNWNETYDFIHSHFEFTPNGELLATAENGGQNRMFFWDISTQERDHTFTINHIPAGNYIDSFAFSKNGKRMAIGDTSGTVYIYEWTGGSAPAAPAQEVEPAPPTALLSNYPNPFNPETWIPYQLSEAAEVTVTIHASDGKLVRTLELGQVPAGVYSEKDRAAYWDGQNEQGEPVASGVYFYTLTAGEFKATRKMVIRK